MLRWPGPLRPCQVAAVHVAMVAPIKLVVLGNKHLHVQSLETAPISIFRPERHPQQHSVFITDSWGRDRHRAAACLFFKLCCLYIKCKHIGKQNALKHASMEVAYK